jgi:hypothetical protein
MVIEVRRHGDNSLRYRAAQISFSCLLHLHQHERSYLAWAVFLPASLHPSVSIVSPHNFIRDHLQPICITNHLYPTKTKAAGTSHLALTLHFGVVIHTANKTLGGVHGVQGICHRLHMHKTRRQRAPCSILVMYNCNKHTCRFAGNPTKRSPLSVKATTDGVVRCPSAFSMTLAVFK